MVMAPFFPFVLKEALSFVNIIADDQRTTSLNTKLTLHHSNFTSCFSCFCTACIEVHCVTCKSSMDATDAARCPRQTYTHISSLRSLLLEDTPRCCSPFFNTYRKHDEARSLAYHSRSHRAPRQHPSHGYERTLRQALEIDVVHDIPVTVMPGNEASYYRPPRVQRPEVREVAPLHVIFFFRTDS